MRSQQLLYAGRTYSAAVLSGTVATTMMPGKCGEELLALLGSGLTEEGISTLLRRWSQPQQHLGGAAGETRDLRIPRRTDSPQDSFVFGRSAFRGQ